MAKGFISKTKVKSSGKDDRRDMGSKADDKEAPKKSRGFVLYTKGK